MILSLKEIIVVSLLLTIIILLVTYIVRAWNRIFKMRRERENHTC